MAFVLGGAAIAQQNNVIVPNVEGIPSGTAAQILRTAGLQPRVQQSANSGALVARQDPRPGYLLPIGSEVLLVTNTMIPAAQAAPVSRNVAIQVPSTEISPAPPVQSTMGATPVYSGTNVSVTPLTTTTVQSSSQPGQYVVMRDSMNFIIAQQPRQAPANQYLLAETTPKRYPIWYPRAYLENQGQTTPLTTSQMPTTTRTSQIQPLTQSSVSPYLIQMQQPVPQQQYSEWYAVPQGWVTSHAWTGQHTGQAQQGYAITSSTQPVYVQNQRVSTGSVPVPNVMQLSQTNAMFAIQKAGLLVGKINLMQNVRTGTGLVIKQSPRPRSLVPPGTPIDLWVAD